MSTEPLLPCKDDQEMPEIQTGVLLERGPTIVLLRDVEGSCGTERNSARHRARKSSAMIEMALIAIVVVSSLVYFGSLITMVSQNSEDYTILYPETSPEPLRAVSILKMENEASYREASPVEVHSKDEFEHYLASTTFVFTVFYTPWCAYSSRFLLPSWQEVAQFLQSDPDILIVQVNCVKHPELCRRQTVFSFPTIRWYENGLFSAPFPLETDKSTHSLINFALERATRKQQGSDSVTGSETKESKLLALTSQDFEPVLGLQETAHVVYEGSSCSSCRALAPAWQEEDRLNVLDGLSARVFRVDCSQQQDMCRRHGVKMIPTLRWYDHGYLEVPDYRQSMFKMSPAKPGSIKVESGPQDFDHGDGNIAAVLKYTPAEKYAAVYEDPTVQDDQTGYVVSLTSDNFDRFLSEHQNVFVTMHAPWCVYSQRLLPIWEKFGHRVSDEGLDLQVAKIDCVAQKDLCSQQKVMAYPTIRWYKNGPPGDSPDYQNTRTVEAFMDYARLKLD